MTAIKITQNDQGSKEMPAELGLWSFVFGDMMIFGLFFFTFTFYRGENPDVFISSQKSLNPIIGVVNTLILLTSSLFVVYAINAIRMQRPKIAKRFFLLAFLCGIGFSIIKITEYSEKIGEGIYPITNDFFMFYFILTGLHLMHVLIGICFLGFLVKICNSPLNKNIKLYESGGIFWHMVDLLWIVLFPLLYLMK